jgi:HD superfamily phosphohydrolase YqeK
MPSPIYDHHIFVGDLTDTELAALRVLHGCVKDMPPQMLVNFVKNAQTYADCVKERERAEVKHG